MRRTRILSRNWWTFTRTGVPIIWRRALSALAIARVSAGQDIAADAGPEGDDQAGDDLDQADCDQEPMPAARHPRDDRGEVHVPIGQDVREFIETRDDRSQREAKMQELISLMGRSRGHQ